MSLDHFYTQGESGEAAIINEVSRPVRVENAQTFYSEDWSFVDAIPQTRPIISQTVASTPGAVEPGTRDMSGFPEFSAEDIELRKTVRSLQKQCDRTLPMREAAISLQSKVDFDNQNLRYARDRVLSSQKGVLDRLSSIVEPRVMSDIQELHDTLLAEYAAFDEQMQQIQTDEQAVSRIHFSLATRDAKIHRDSTHLLALVSTSPNDEALATEGTDQSEEDVVTDRTEESPTLTRYHRAVADVGIMWERMQSVKFDHHEELVVRGFRQDREEPVSMTDEEFEAAYAKELAAAQSAYRESIANADDARQACLDEGIALENHRPVEETLAQPTTGPEEESPPLLALDGEPLPLDLHPRFDEFMPSPACQSATTGAMISGELRLKRSKSEKAFKDAAVAHWIQSTPDEHDQDERWGDSLYLYDGRPSPCTALATQMREDQSAVDTAMEQSTNEPEQSAAVQATTPEFKPTAGKLSDEHAAASDMPMFSQHTFSLALPTRRHSATSLGPISPLEQPRDASSNVKENLLQPPPRCSSDTSLVHRCRHDSAQDIHNTNEATGEDSQAETLQDEPRLPCTRAESARFSYQDWK